MSHSMPWDWLTNGGNHIEFDSLESLDVKVVQSMNLFETDVRSWIGPYDRFFYSINAPSLQYVSVEACSFTFSLLVKLLESVSSLKRLQITLPANNVIRLYDTKPSAQLRRIIYKHSLVVLSTTDAIELANDIFCVPNLAEGSKLELSEFSAHLDITGIGWTFLKILTIYTEIDFEDVAKMLEIMTGLLVLDARNCRDIPIPPQYWDIASNESPAFVDIQGLPFSIDVGETVCIRVVVPNDADKSKPMLFAPFPGTPWDSVMLDLVGNSTGISVPVELNPANDMRNDARFSTHVYEADVLLRDVDTYRPKGYVEFRDAQWNPEDPQEPQPYIPEKLYVSYLLEIPVVDRYGASPYSLSNYLQLPQCRVSDPEGRWVSVDDIPFDVTTLPLPDNNNRIWMPYNCQLKRISYKDFAQCLLEKYPNMHLFGDSNTRRYLKKITTLGEWCGTAEEHNTTGCICEDHKDPFERFSAEARRSFIDMDPLDGGRTPNGTFSETSAPANKSRIFFHKWEGLMEKQHVDWQDVFKDNKIETAYGHPQVAVFSLINWDSAFLSRELFLRYLDLLVDYIKHGYSARTEIIVRTGQYYCCRSDASTKKRKFSRLRNKSFDQQAIDKFKSRLGAKHKVSVWDVSAISENLPYETRKQAVVCASNHVRSEIVETENQVFFNHLCGA
ncbi:hypothetical protein IW140_005020 [Coemansia sp. RSA 1813]|nr:hypothetical protein IW140_005020 [Coemansia sp. RSA 1813]